MPRSIQMTEYGSPSVLKAVEVSIPDPGPDEVIIRSAICPVNRADCEIRSGHWKIQKENPFPYTPGLEVTGTVYSKGTDVKLPVGTKVITMMQRLGGIHGTRPGGYQEFVKVPASTLATLHKEVDLTAMGALGLAAVTAYNGISQLGLKSGHRVIIMGSSGGVGSMAVQFAAALGAYVIAPIQSMKKKTEITKLGAKEILDLSDTDWHSKVSEKVDAVFEMVGGEIFNKCVSLLRPKGKLCTIGAISGGDAHFSVWDLLHGLQLTGWSSEDMTAQELQKAIDGISHLFTEGKIQLPPIKAFPLEKASTAHTEMESGTHVGRILLTC